jgi:hypothetical protein
MNSAARTVRRRYRTPALRRRSLLPARRASAARFGQSVRVVRFRLGDLALVVGAAGGVVADLGDCGQVEGVVQFAVASGVEPVALGGPAGGFAGGGAVVGGEPVRASRTVPGSPTWPRMNPATMGPMPCGSSSDVPDAVTASPTPTLGSGDVAVDTTHVGQQLESETFALNRSSPLGVDVA